MTSPEQEFRFMPQSESGWEAISKERFLDPATQKKYFDMKRRFPTVETRSRQEYKDKCIQGLHCEPPADLFVDEYAELLDPDAYQKNVEAVFVPTLCLPSSSFSSSPQTLGYSGGRGYAGIVFTDAQYADGTFLGDYQKEIIAAHEKAHGILEPLTKGEEAYILGCFEVPESGVVLDGYEPKMQAIELLVRMSQLKNYLKFHAGREFTKGDLDETRMLYIIENGLDNNMTEFFNAITPEKEEQFIRLMNEVAC